MKIVVIGGTGLIGTKVVAQLRQRGHQVIAASPATGINTITGEGLAEAMSDNALSDLALTSATLNALMQNITTAADIPLDDVKALIVRCLKAFQD